MSITANPKVTTDRLKTLLHYDPETGLFTWKVAPNGSTKIGQTAGSFDKFGYIRIKIDGRNYAAHRLAWFYVYGEWPTNQIDHRHGVRADNRIAFLRPATSAQNTYNTKRMSTNKSGLKGAFFHKDNKRWCAKIRHGGVPKHLGYFDTAEQAHEAYKTAAVALRGEYARSS